MRTSVLLGVLCLAPFALADDDAVVARVNGADISADVYSRWLMERHGHVYLKDFLREQVILQAAGEAGVLPTDAQAEAAWESERQTIIDNVHHGDEKNWISSLDDQGLDPTPFGKRRTAAWRSTLALRALAQLERSFTEEELRDRYKSVYGELGERLTLQVLRYDMWADADPENDRPDLASLRKSAERRAEAATASWRAGTAFGDLLEDSDDPGSEFVVHGVVSPYRKLLLGPEVEETVPQLDDLGQISDPIEVWDGYVVIRLVERVERSFDQARDEIEGLLRAAPVDSSETGNIEERLMNAAEPERLLR